MFRQTVRHSETSRDAYVQCLSANMQTILVCCDLLTYGSIKMWICHIFWLWYFLTMTLTLIQTVNDPHGAQLDPNPPSWRESDKKIWNFKSLCIKHLPLRIWSPCMYLQTLHVHGKQSIPRYRVCAPTSLTMPDALTNRNPQTSKAPLNSQAQGTTLFTRAVSNIIRGHE